MKTFKVIQQEGGIMCNCQISIGGSKYFAYKILDKYIVPFGSLIEVYDESDNILLIRPGIKKLLEEDIRKGGLSVAGGLVLKLPKYFEASPSEYLVKIHDTLIDYGVIEFVYVTTTWYTFKHKDDDYLMIPLETHPSQNSLYPVREYALRDFECTQYTEFVNKELGGFIENGTAEE